MNDEPADTIATPLDSPPDGADMPWLRLVSIVPGWSHAPDAALSQSEARQRWALLTSTWHPTLLDQSAVLPAVRAPEDVGAAEPHDWHIVASAWPHPAAGDTRIAEVDASLPRAAIVESLRAQICPDAPACVELDPELTVDFFALGFAVQSLAALTVAMGHAEVIDHVSLTREVRGAAKACLDGDANGAKNRLRAAFEVLTQGRERFYPVDDYILDWVLVDAASLAAESPVFARDLTACFAGQVPFTLIASGRAIELLAQNAPDCHARLLDAIDHGWADVAGGPYTEAPEPLMPLESVIWQHQHGSDSYQRAFQGRNIEAFARRDSGLYPMLPQIARRFGVRFGYHIALDEGRFPIPRETKRLWEAPDGSSLEVLSRPPLSAHSEVDGCEFPWRLARTLKDDHVAVLPFARWPRLDEGWFNDLRRSAAYSPVFGRWVTIGDFFTRTDRPWDPLRSRLDDYQFPYLIQAVRAERVDPITRGARHARGRAAIEAARWLRAVHGVLDPSAATDDAPLESVERSLECAPAREPLAAIDDLSSHDAEAVARLVVGSAAGESPGFLVLNPLGWNRRVAVHLPDAAMDLGVSGALRASQFTEDGVWGVVELPAHGFAWIPASPAADLSSPPAGVRVSGNTLTNGVVEVELDPKTGGLRSVQRPGEPTPRLAQQLTVLGLAGTSNEPRAIRMVAERVEVEYGGPALAQAVSVGSLVDPTSPGEALARFRQRVRLWWGRPLVELRIELDSISPALERSLRESQSPWDHVVVCRWAWADSTATLRRSSLLGLEPTEAPRPETAEIFEVSNRGQRTAVFFGGIAHHQRHGTRMLDTLLVAGREAARTFDISIGLDLEYPAQAALDFVTPAIVVPNVYGPPKSAAAGWFFQHDMPAVAVTRVEVARDPETQRAIGITMHLLETSGRSTRGRLRMFKNPTSARLVDLQGEAIMDLDTEADAVHIDLTPRELACVQVRID